LALHVLNNTPYLVTAPDKCLSYNKWGRPNPPYVIFKYDGSTWHRIPLSEFPVEFKNINLVIETRNDEKEFTKQSPLKPEVIQKFNSNLSQPEFQTIARTPGSYSETGCINLVYYKGAWVGPGNSIGRSMRDGECQSNDASMKEGCTQSAEPQSYK
jgi:hypothetical protein